MNILILGSGGREHAFAWKIAQSPKCSQLYIAPGNAGTQNCGENIAIEIEDFEAIKKFCIQKNINMVVVGPEAPLVKGIYDYFTSDDELSAISIIGPSKAAAQLEGSKDFSKQFMQKYNIPTAAYKSFDKSNLQEGLDFLTQQTAPIVLKADGLAAGKGVLICESVEEAKKEFKNMLDGKFGPASNKVVVEEFLKGMEFSVFVLTDGKNYTILPNAKDYKRIGEGDTGLNTGGMGAISPVPFVDQELLNKVEQEIIIPTIKGLQKEQLIYKGFIYIGLILVGDQPYVIEYNVRMGDPETEVVIPRIKNDLVELFEGVAQGNLHEKNFQEIPEVAATIVLASGGYPEDYQKGKVINNLHKTNNCIVFHAGTKLQNDQVTTSGGRVIAVTAFGKDIAEALTFSNQNATIITFEGKYFRKDIGLDVI